MSDYEDVPISAAKRIAEDFDKDQVIVVTWDKAHGRTHVTTYGKTVEECAQAADGGNAVKRALGWPESLCNAEPSRVTALRTALEGAVRALEAAKRNHDSMCAARSWNYVLDGEPAITPADESRCNCGASWRNAAIDLAVAKARRALEEK